MKALTTGDFSEGASTFTQQLLKNNVFTNWTSESTQLERFTRKIQEQYLAVQVEKKTDKDTWVPVPTVYRLPHDSILTRMYGI